jgi:1,4-dihydroxy-2-naphthoyl-CoA synthase
VSDSKSEERVRLNIEDGIATVTLDRPNKLNALYPEMILRLVDVIEQIRRDNNVRVMVLRGEAAASARVTTSRRKIASSTGRPICNRGCEPAFHAP